MTKRCVHALGSIKDVLGKPAYGGVMDGAGPTIVNGMVYVHSGYAGHSTASIDDLTGKEGNLLIAFFHRRQMIDVSRCMSIARPGSGVHRPMKDFLDAATLLSRVKLYQAQRFGAASSRRRRDLPYT